MTNKTGLILGGLLLTLIGLISFLLGFIYVSTINSNLDYILIFPVLIMTLGINFLVRGFKTKKQADLQ